MTTQVTDKYQEQFHDTVRQFFVTIFDKAIKSGCGKIEIKKGFEGQNLHEVGYYDDIENAISSAYQVCQAGMDVYLGVNPRIGEESKKENIKYLAAFHAEIDYGTLGHKEKPNFETRSEAEKQINEFRVKPTILVHSGGGFHCYWVLNEPANASDESAQKHYEDINKALLQALGAPSGTQNINRHLRVPSTYNFKEPSKPRKVEVIWSDGPKYEVSELETLLEDTQKQSVKTKKREPESCGKSALDTSISKLPVSDRMKSLITNGNDGTYPSRSEADQAVITALVNKGYEYREIKKIFENNKIGEKYRDHSSGEDYLKHNIEKAKEFSNLSEQERENPLFICGAIHKDDNDKYYLKTVPFQEYMNKKHMLKYLEKEKTFFRYNGKCYEQCHEERLNFLCQNELGTHRDLFTKSVLSNFIHFSIADDLVGTEKAFEDQVRYLTMQNGLYDLVEHQLIEHAPDIFTTNLLPYDFDPDAKCPRWTQYLREVFLDDENQITFIQEAIGYAFHKAIPKPALFFLVGNGSNGKSVFIDTLTSLCGKDNVSNISWNLLSNEIYILDLFGKMINVSSETPNKKLVNTDLVKAVVGGDWVTGRELYKRPSKFKPFAKHYLAMNQLPAITDDTHGMWRRIYIIEFQRTFKEEEMDVELTDRLRGELSGIFNWALEGFKRLRNQSFIFSRSTSMESNKKQYQFQTNSTLKFISCYFDKSSNFHSISFKDIYDQYQEFCKSEGDRNPYSKSQFKDSLNKQGYEVVNSSKHANQLRIFGIEIKSMK